MAVFRVEKNSGYTVMSNHHLRNRALSLKAKGLLSQMLSLPEDWDYTLQGLARINRESIDAIRQAIRELEQAGYIQRSRERDEKGRLRGADYVIFELPQPVPASVSPTLENPTLENPTQENPTLENPMQLNKDKLITEKQKKEGLNTDSIPIHSPNPLPLDEDETAASPPERTGSRKEAAYQIYRDLILENIEYDTLTQNPRIDREQLDEIQSFQYYILPGLIQYLYLKPAFVLSEFLQFLHKTVLYFVFQQILHLFSYYLLFFFT